MQIYNAILQNAASEQSARMVAMRNATDAARDMIDSLTLALNKARQDQITSELLDIVGGAAGDGIVAKNDLFSNSPAEQSGDAICELVTVSQRFVTFRELHC